MRIICHTDRDGVTAGALVYNWAQSMSKIMVDHHTGYIIVDEHIGIPRAPGSMLFYTEQNMLKFVDGEDISIYKSGYEYNDEDGRYDDVADEELFIFVDLSISDNALRCISKILNQGGTILWLDHHKTTIDNAAKIKETIKGYEDNVCILCDTSASGSLLAWATFYTDFDWSITDAGLNAREVFPYLVDDYDRWKFRFDTDEKKTTTWFGYGFDTNPEAFDPMSNFNRDLIFSTMWTILAELNKNDPVEITGLNPSEKQMCEIARRTRMRELIDAVFDLVDDKNVTLDSLIETGRHIDRYVTSTNAVTYKTYGARYHIKIDYTERDKEGNVVREETTEFDCAAINRSSNSLIFGEDYNKYPVCIVYSWVPSLNHYKYTLYSNVDKFNDTWYSNVYEDYISCDKIAAYFGGGGHPGAAGFKLKFNIFDFGLCSAGTTISLNASRGFICNDDNNGTISIVVNPLEEKTEE